jgi:exonuclease III
VRLVTWNLQHGGGRRGPSIAQAVGSLAADVVVLTEYREASGEPLRRALEAAGLRFQLSPAPIASRVNSLLVASRTPLHEGDVARPVGASERWLHVHVRDHNVEVGALYIPDARRGSDAKQRYWAWLLEAAQGLLVRPAVLIGDANTGAGAEDAEGAPFACSEAFLRLLEQGWRDAFRELHGGTPAFSWWSSAGNGFRLDHAFLSPSLGRRLVSVEYPQRHGSGTYTHRIGTQVFPYGLSDHTPLVVELEAPGRRTLAPPG